MNGEESSRKLMNPSSEVLFFSLIKQLHENQPDDLLRAKTLKALTAMRNLQLSPKGVSQFRQECYDHLCKLMETLMQQQNKLWSTTWVFIVEQMGKDLHADNKFLNSILSVLEQGMKRKDPLSMMWSLTCWQVLIDNFALSPKMISAPRRVALLTIPLKAKNVKDLEVLEQKFKLWWHLFLKLGPHLDMHAEYVSKPFLLFTFGPFEQGNSHLINKFPGIARTAMNFLTSFIATGVADNELKQISTPFESPRPLMNDGKVFLCLAEFTIKSIDILLKLPEDLPVRTLEVLLSSTLARIVTLCKENYSYGGEVLASFLNMLKGTLFGLIVLKKKYKELLLFVVETALEKLPLHLLDLKLKNTNHTTARDFLFSLLSDKEHLLLHAKPSIQKAEERQCVILSRLLESPGALVAQPDRLANAKMLVDALTEMQDMSQGEAAKKCFHLWEQCCRFLCKIPKEVPNEQCNQISQKIFLSLLLMPFKLILKNDSAGSLSSAALENSVVKGLKNLFFYYSETVFLSLTVTMASSSPARRVDPCQKVYQSIGAMLMAEKYPPPTCQTLVKVISKFTMARSNISYTKLFGKNVCRDVEMAELMLFSKLTNLLVSLAPDSPQIAGKMSAYIAKDLENLVLLVSSTESLVEAIKIFFELLTKTPSAHWPNTGMDVTDPWNSLVSPFRKILSDPVEYEKKKSLLLGIKPLIETLMNHSDIKVCNAAREMHDKFTRQENGDSSNSADGVKPSPTTRTPSRKRSFMVAQSSSPVTSQDLSPSQKVPNKPSLEDLDSQDFVKIPSQNKIKKPLTPHQREVKRRRRDDIPALYQGLSQDTHMSQDTQDESPIFEIPKIMLSVPTSTSPWCEDAMDVDLALMKKDDSDENKSLNSQEESVQAQVETCEDDLKKLKDSQEIEIVENSQCYITVPILPNLKPDVELQVHRARNRQGVLLPAVKASREPEIMVVKEAAPNINKRKSLPPVRGAGLKGRAAQMVGLAFTNETPTAPEAKHKDTSTPGQVMSSLMLNNKSDTKPAEDPVNDNDLSPAKGATPNVAVTPISSHRKRSNLKKDAAATPSPKSHKRVSFAEPIVSGEQDSPTVFQDIQIYNNYYKQSPTTKKKMKASRKLLLAPKDGFQIIKEQMTSQGSLEKEQPSDEAGPIEPALIDSTIPISKIADKLVSPMLADELVRQLEERNVGTVHDLNMLSELAISDLPIKEPKIATVKTILKLLLDEESEESSEVGKEKPEAADVTTEIENLPLTQIETVPNISTVTTHGDTVPAIEEVETSPENESPVEVLEEEQVVEPSPDIPLEESPSALEVLPAADEEEKASLDGDVSTQIIVESSLEPEESMPGVDETPDVVADEEDKMDNAPEMHEDMVSEESQAEQYITTPVKIEPTAEDTYAAMSKLEKQRLRKMMLETSEEQELLDNLSSRSVNFLATQSTADLLQEINRRSCTAEILKMLDGTPDILIYAENNTDLSQLMQKRSGDEIASALTKLSETNSKISADSVNAFLSSVDTSLLTEFFKNIESKICDSLSLAAVQDRVKTSMKTDSDLADSILNTANATSVVKNIIDRCPQVSFTNQQASTMYAQIKLQVSSDDSTKEILDKLDQKLKEGSVSSEEIQERAVLKKLILAGMEQEEIISELKLADQKEQSQVSDLLSNEDLLSMVSAKLLGQQDLTITSKMLRVLEQLSLYLPTNSVLSLVKTRVTDEETSLKAVRMLAEKTDLAKVLELYPEQQLLTLLKSLLDNTEKRSKVSETVVAELKSGELCSLLGADKLVEVMTLAMVQGDIKPLVAIPKIFCNSDIVDASCQIFKAGASDSQMEMMKAAFPKHILASWVSEIIMK